MRDLYINSRLFKELNWKKSYTCLSNCLRMQSCIYGAPSVTQNARKAVLGMAEVAKSIKDAYFGFYKKEV